MPAKFKLSGSSDLCPSFTQRALRVIFFLTSLSISKTSIIEENLIYFSNLFGMFNTPRYFNTIFVDHLLQPSSDRCNNHVPPLKCWLLFKSTSFRKFSYITTYNLTPAMVLQRRLFPL